jgi:hypothetical protein
MAGSWGREGIGAGRVAQAAAPESKQIIAARSRAMDLAIKNLWPGDSKMPLGYHHVPSAHRAIDSCLSGIEKRMFGCKRPTADGPQQPPHKRLVLVDPQTI